MNDDFKAYCKDLEHNIISAQQSSPTLDEAEKLAAQFLAAQIRVGEHLAALDLTARMRKSGLKAVRAAVYIEAATKSEKKPTEAMLSATVDTDKLVMGEQEGFDSAEVATNELKNLLDVYKNAHIYFRGLAKGRFE